MEKKPGIRLVFVLIITGIFFIPLVQKESSAYKGG